MDFIEILKTREPEYDEQYYNFILDFTLEQGAKMGTTSEEEKWLQGKFFSTRYEIYIYATFLGLKKNYKIPFDKGTKRKKFINIGSWRPVDLTNYLLISVLGKMEMNLFELENMSEDELKSKATEIKKEIEEYANGGFDLIRSKVQEEGDFFKQNDMSFVELLN